MKLCVIKQSIDKTRRMSKKATADVHVKAHLLQTETQQRSLSNIKRHNPSNQTVCQLKLHGSNKSNQIINERLFLNNTFTISNHETRHNTNVINLDPDRRDLQNSLQI